VETEPLQSIDTDALRDLVMSAMRRTFADLGSVVRAGAVILVAVGAAVKAVLSWQAGGISGLQMLAVLVTIVLYEVAAIRSLPDFHGLSFALLLALPLAVWVGLQIIQSTSAREEKKAWVRADMRRYREALRQDPQNVAAHVLLGDSYLRLGKNAAAEQEYMAALRLDPTEYEARYKLERMRRG
jgi:hypothetical protein